MLRGSITKHLVSTPNEHGLKCYLVVDLRAGVDHASLVVDRLAARR